MSDEQKDYRYRGNFPLHSARVLDAFDQSAENVMPSATQLTYDHKMSLQELVQSPAWEAIIRIKQRMAIRQPIPMEIAHMVGYIAGNVACDTLDSFIQQIKEEAGISNKGEQPCQ